MYQGAVEPNAPVAQGWLRVSHRELDAATSKPWRPVHTHTNRQMLTPGEMYEIDVELWPTSIVVPAGYTVGFSVRGNDYVFEGEGDPDKLTIESFAHPFTGSGPFIHVDPRNRPAQLFSGTTTVHVGPDRPGSVLTPVIPRAI